MNKQYCVYHLHSDLSLLDSTTKFEDYVKKTAQLGYKAIASTEHGNIYNWTEKKALCDSYGIKYIHGCEIYLTEELFHKRIKSIGELEDYKIRDNYHTILLAKNEDGIKELNSIVSKSTQKDHFYYKPRISFEEFLNLSDNVIKISACFVKGTKVLTKSGYKNIEDIRTGDYVKNMFGDWEYVNFPTITPYSGEMSEIYFTGNDIPIKCTSNHKFLTITLNDRKPKWVSVLDFNTITGSSKHICLNPISIRYSSNNIIHRNEWDNCLKCPKSKLKFSLPDKIEITNELARFFGYFLGDGWIQTKNNIRCGISINSLEFEYRYNEFIKPIEEQLGIKFYILERDNNKYDVTTASVDFVNFMYYIFGDAKANTKYIPNRIKHISKDTDIEILFGYMLADGYFSESKFDSYVSGEMIYVSVSENLAKSVKDVFESLHIKDNIYTAKKKIDKNGVKHQKAWYGSIYGKALLNVSKQSLFSHEDIVNIFNNLIENNRKNFFEYNNITYKKEYIKNIKFYTSNEVVYCLNNNTHSFVCNNVVVHNCLASPLARLETRKKELTQEINKIKSEFQVRASEIESILNDKESQEFLDDLIEKYQYELEFLKSFVDYKENQLDKLNEYYDKLLNKYDYYEIQYHNVEDQIVYNKKLYELSKKYNKPLIAGTDTHSIDKYKSECRIILQKAKTGSIFGKSKKDSGADFSTLEDEFDLTYKTYDELVEEFKAQKSLPEDVFMQAIENTNIMADSIEDFKLDESIKYPHISDDDDKMLCDRIDKMFKDKLDKGIIPIEQKEQFEKNIEEEIRVFRKVDMMGFMLFMSDICIWAKTNGHPLGTSRGSCGGSSIAYITDIIDLNPVKWKTMFSRFCNEHRKEVGD